MYTDLKEALHVDSYLLDIRPSSEFEYTSAKNKLMALDFTFQQRRRMTFTVPGDDLEDNNPFANGLDSMGGSRPRDRYARLASRIDLESYLTVGRYLIP